MPSEELHPDAKVSHVQMLFVQHTPVLRGFILALLPDFSRVDDILQETFLTVTKKAAEFQPGSNFVGWACTIARFKVLESGRHKGRTQPLSCEVIESLCACEPEAVEDGEDRLRLLAECMKQLAPQSRRAIELRYQQAHKPAEIARQIGWTAEAVYVALSRARTILRQCVEKKLLEGAS